MLVQQFERIHEKKEQSLILISHQERIIQMADRIMVIENGKIGAIGTRDEILPSLLSEDSVHVWTANKKEELKLRKQLDKIVEKVLEQIDGAGFRQKGAFNLRYNGTALCHGDSEHIKIKKKTDRQGIDIYIDENTNGEQVHIPVVVNATGMKDEVYNDFFVADGRRDHNRRMRYP
ncbi:hypothetical protein LAJLEIBI_02968 [[Clostridium] hylemonae DSM 15053]|nr:hypothetical protein LAJLEIBI_02968 [[Clostridium] hylemonae DSM 15053]